MWDGRTPRRPPYQPRGEWNPLTTAAIGRAARLRGGPVKDSADNDGFVAHETVKLLRVERVAARPLVGQACILRSVSMLHLQGMPNRGLASCPQPGHASMATMATWAGSASVCEDKGQPPTDTQLYYRIAPQDSPSRTCGKKNTREHTHDPTLISKLWCGPRQSVKGHPRG